jgi:tRNA-dihydrouridine synthase
MYRGNADWGAIARAVELAKNSESLVLGNGDLQNMNDVYRRVHETGVDGVLLGRSAQGNPWIFRTKDQVKQALRSNDAASIPHSAISLEERFRVMIEHSMRFEKHRGIPCFVGMRKHLTWYCKALYRASELRSQMVRVNNAREVVKCLRNYAALVALAFNINESRVAGIDETTLHPRPSALAL